MSELWEPIGDRLERRVLRDFLSKYRVPEEIARCLPEIDRLARKRTRIFASANVHAIEHYRRINSAMVGEVA